MEDFWCNIEWFVHRYQTLIGSLIALAAAISTILVMRKQGRQDQARHSSELDRKRKAARARMPDALSALSTYQAEVAEFLVGSRELISPPDLAIQTLKGVIEFIDDDASERTYELTTFYQVHQSRLSNRQPEYEHERVQRLFDLAWLSALTNSLYDYARGRSDKMDTEKITVEEARSASLFIDLTEHNEDKPYDNNMLASLLGSESSQEETIQTSSD